MSSTERDEQLADEHEGRDCACGACERTRERDASRVRAREARTRGGLFPLARELLGQRWLDGFTLGDAMEVSQLAQHTLGNIFEELEKLGDTTRRKLVGERYAATLPDHINRAEVATAINYAESLIEFARAQLGYLPESPYALNTAIAMVSKSGTETLGVYMGVSKGGNARVRVDHYEPGASGADPLFYEVPFTNVRPVAL